MGQFRPVAILLSRLGCPGVRSAIIFFVLPIAWAPGSGRLVIRLIASPGIRQTTTSERRSLPYLGTDIGATALTAPVRFVQKLLGSVTGAGIKRNIADCYEFIVNHYEEGDLIFLFGFSRGAYTVRSLANLLMLVGVPTKTPAGPLLRYRKAVKDIAWEVVDTVLEHGAGHPRTEFEDERLELARRFQLGYGSGDGSDANVAPYFVGVFDTVAALGASGLRYLVIQAGLAAGVAAAAFAAGFLPAVLTALLCSWSFGAGFMLSGFLAQVAIIAAALGGFWYWQNKATIKTISSLGRVTMKPKRL
jgi:hypothetical protein